MIPLALNGVEALPALLRFERQFTVKKLRADLDVRGSAHIQVLSVVTAILKNERISGLDRLKPVYNQQQLDAIVSLANSFLESTPAKNYRARRRDEHQAGTTLKMECACNAVVATSSRGNLSEALT